MKRNVFTAILLGMATTLAVQASFADESSLMENRMVQLNQHAIEQAQQQTGHGANRERHRCAGLNAACQERFLSPATLKSPAHAGLLVQASFSSAATPLR
ncbi:hypothetical protein P4234_31755 [Pseudomonas aeruginosa]|nr:hypothetical protein [Pseudomonas aeruginosa]